MDRVKFDGIYYSQWITLLTPRADAVSLRLFIHTLTWLTPPTTQQYIIIVVTHHHSSSVIMISVQMYVSMYVCSVCMCSVSIYVVYLSMQCMSGCIPPHSTQKQKHSSQLVTSQQLHIIIVVVHPSQQLHMSQQLYIHHSG